MIVVEAVPNISTSDDEIISKLKCFSTLKNVHVDSFYNRSVFTFIGGLEIFEDVLGFINSAIEQIDMRRHKGVHPRCGAVDVVPFVALKGIEEKALIERVDVFAALINKNTNIPVYLYAKSARNTQRTLLKSIRSGEYEALESKFKKGEFLPDFGKAEFCPRSGIIVVGVRDLMVAYNIGLNTDNLQLAKDIAAKIRESGKQGKPGMFKKLQALGVKTGNNVEVTMNFLDVNLSVYKVFEVIESLSVTHGINILYSEFIGMVPESVVNKGDIAKLRLRNFSSEHILYGF